MALGWKHVVINASIGMFLTELDPLPQHIVGPDGLHKLVFGKCPMTTEWIGQSEDIHCRAVNERVTHGHSLLRGGGWC